MDLFGSFQIKCPPLLHWKFFVLFDILISGVHGFLAGWSCRPNIILSREKTSALSLWAVADSPITKKEDCIGVETWRKKDKSVALYVGIPI